MTATHITWSAILDGEDEPCVTRCTTRVVHLLSLKPEGAAAEVLKRWLVATPDGVVGVPSNWAFFLDDGDADASAIVVIHEPPNLAGTYAIAAERVTTTTGHFAESSAVARANAILAKHAEKAA